jgi:hypothetical protein
LRYNVLENPKRKEVKGMEDLRTASEERIKVFVPGARLLASEEILRIPEQNIHKTPGEGVWLEIACPDRSCVISEGKIALEVTCARDKESEGVWMKLFCPEERCFAEEATDIPS